MKHTSLKTNKNKCDNTKQYPDNYMGVYNGYFTRNTSKNTHPMRHKGVGLRGYESICAIYYRFYYDAVAL